MTRTRLSPDTTIRIVVPHDPRGPFIVTLSDAANALRAGQMPWSATAQIQPSGRWLPIAEALALCPEVAPTRSTGLAFGMLWIPVLLAGSTWALFDSLDLPFDLTMLRLWSAAILVGFVGAIALLVVPSLRTRTGGQLVAAAPLPVRVGLGAMIGALELVSVWHGMRARDVARALNAAYFGEDCAALKTLPWNDLSDEDKEHATVARVKCDELEKARRAEARTTASCNAYLKAVREHRPPSDNDASVLQLGREFSIRLAKGDLETSDLKLDRHSFSECVEIWGAFVSAVETSPRVWDGVETEDDLSTDLLEHLKSHGVKLADGPRATLEHQTGRVAAAAITTSASDDAKASARGLCELAAAIGTAPASCKQLTAQAAAAEAAASARDRAREQRCQAIQAQRNACYDRCDQAPFNPLDEGQDDPLFGCDEKCDKRFPMTDCE